METQIITQEIVQTTTDIQVKLTDLKTEVETRQINTQDDLLNSGDLLKRIKDFSKIIDERRRSFVKPLNDTVDKINAEFKPKIILAEEIRRILEKKMANFNEIQQKIKEAELKRQREEEARQLAERQKKIEELAIENNSETMINEAIKVEKQINRLEARPIRVEQTVKSESVATTFRKVWDFEIIQQGSVPREYCSPDATLLRNAIKNGIREIPGVKIFEKTIVGSR